MSKKWVIRDLDGNLPTKDETEALRRALTQEEYTQRVWSATSPGDDPEGPLSRCEWGFEDGNEVSLVEGLNQFIESLQDTVRDLGQENSSMAGVIDALRAELARRPTIIDFLRVGYRMVRG
jgi:hypothetical protein